MHKPRGMASTGIQADIYAIYDERERVRAYRVRQQAVYETASDAFHRRETSARSATAMRIEELAATYMQHDTATGALSDVEQMLVELNELRMDEEGRLARIAERERELRALQQRISEASAQVGAALGDVAHVRSAMKGRERAEAEALAALEAERDAARADVEEAAAREARAVIGAWDFETARVVREVGREFESRKLARAPATAAAHTSVEAEAERYTAEARARSKAIAGELAALAVSEFRGCVRPELARLDAQRDAHAAAGDALAATRAQLRAALASLSAGNESRLDVAALLAGLAPDAGDAQAPAPQAAGATFAPSVGALDDAASASAGASPPASAGGGSVVSRGRAGWGGAAAAAGSVAPAHRSVAAGLAAAMGSAAPASPGFGAPPRALPQQQYLRATTSSLHRAASVAGGGGRRRPGPGDAAERAPGRSSSVPPPAGPERRHLLVQPEVRSPPLAAAAAIAPHSRRPGPQRQQQQQQQQQRDATATLAWWTAAPDRVAAAEARDAATAGLSVSEARAELRRLVSRVLERWAALPGYDAAEAVDFIRASQRVAASASRAGRGAAPQAEDAEDAAAAAAAVESPAAGYRQEALALRDGRLEEAQAREARLSVLLAEWAAEGRVIAKASAAAGGAAAAAAAEARRRLELLEPQIREHRAWLAARKGARPGFARSAGS